MGNFSHVDSGGVYERSPLVRRVKVWSARNRRQIKHRIPFLSIPSTSSTFSIYSICLWSVSSLEAASYSRVRERLEEAEGRLAQLQRRAGDTSATQLCMPPPRAPPPQDVMHKVDGEQPTAAQLGSNREAPVDEPTYELSLGLSLIPSPLHSRPAPPLPSPPPIRFAHPLLRGTLPYCGVVGCYTNGMVISH